MLSVVGVVGLSPGQVEQNATGSPVPRHNYSVLFLLVVVSFFLFFFQDGVLETALEQRRHDTNTQMLCGWGGVGRTHPSLARGQQQRGTGWLDGLLAEGGSLSPPTTRCFTILNYDN